MWIIVADEPEDVVEDARIADVIDEVLDDVGAAAKELQGLCALAMKEGCDALCAVVGDLLLIRTHRLGAHFEEGVELLQQLSVVVDSVRELPDFSAEDFGARGRILYPSLLVIADSGDFHDVVDDLLKSTLLHAAVITRKNNQKIGVCELLEKDAHACGGSTNNSMSFLFCDLHSWMRSGSSISCSRVTSGFSSSESMADC